MACSTGAPRLLQVEPFLEPRLGFAQARGLALGLRESLDTAQPGGFEIEQDLAGQGFHLLARQMDRDPLAIGDDAQFRERLLDPIQLLAQGLQSPADLARLDAVLAQLDEGLDGDEVRKRCTVRRRESGPAAPSFEAGARKGRTGGTHRPGSIPPSAPSEARVHFNRAST